MSAPAPLPVRARAWYALERPDGVGWATNVAASVGGALAMNGLVFGMGWAGSGAERPTDPPGALVGVVWVGLFVALGTARWCVLRAEAATGRRPHGMRLVTGVQVLCLVYPVYALSVRSPVPGLVGNIVTAAAAGAVAWRIRRRSAVAAGLVGLLLPWLAYASLSIVRGLAGVATSPAD